ncbi:hypothetical protein CH249_14720 [Rhodococcus sp. 05-2255-3B1]|uniref:hypothetical protein n=1 Tax=unclassified Rhodococcus (in: high G+C Gram-positive bacteria) TaxID=192944 RepID=UPI000B9B5F6A|nr:MULTISPECIES: hypothetical protein [unclassified Rhodococcus (in: high G+C Gram-positive bacteria)]OZE03067.1 hypothetical protein CH250_22785 [Rhodococcus sp. 05-2255-3C]OZE09457.1 hypothetical protein CH249_14720 [Rhodococcus sp. 05-2255-3B1]
MAEPKKIVCKLYTRSRPIMKAVKEFCETHEFEVAINMGDRPDTASFVVTCADHTRDTVILANMYCTPLSRCDVITLPEGDLYLAAAARYSRGLTLVGSDHVRRKDPGNKEPEGVLF